ncbi:MAG: glycosyltransferase, partial [Epulopiscium sp.]|nr:glycosyltransferase [Candidatus Epulonipiscium sp.]
MQKKLICAIIVTYNCDKNFYSCFASVYNAVSKVVIVDNGSREETLSI